MQNSLLLASTRRNTVISVMMLLALALSACGFQLRGAADLSFKSLYIQGPKLSITKDLERSLKSNGIKLTQTSEDADLLLEMMSETNQKRIQALSGGGLVREYELIYFLNYRIRQADSPIWGPVQTIRGRRDLSYDDNTLLAKAEEETRLYADMRNDAVRELLRRLTAFKPKTAQK